MISLVNELLLCLRQYLHLAFLSPFVANEPGFIHNLSPVKKSKKTKRDWYEFQFQTSSIDVKRVVGFNIPSHQTLKHYEENKVPVQLKNIVIKEDEDCIFNQQSVVHQTAVSDITFQYVEQVKQDGLSDTVAPTSVTVSQINELTPNQKVNLTATLTMGKDKPKPVELKSSGETVSVKEDCVLEDETGAIMAHIWNPLIDDLENGQSYIFKNLTVKNYQGSTFLSTTPFTTVSPTTQALPKLTGPKMLENPTKEITVDKIKLVSKLNIFSSCLVCKRRLNDVESGNTLKCHNCGTRQRSSDIKRQASLRLCFPDEETGEDLWLQAFTEHLHALLGDSGVTLKHTVDDIEEHLMSLDGVHIRYNVQTKNITEIGLF